MNTKSDHREDSTGHELFGDVIHSYSRKEALNDGTLIDVSETAREAGIRFPVALTWATWNKCVDMPPGIEKQGIQSESGRLWDVISMLRFNIAGCQSDTLTYQLYVKKDPEKDAKLISLKAYIHPGDNLEPVITIMLPHED